MYFDPRCIGVLFPRRSAVVRFDRGPLCFRIFYSTIPVDVARVKSYVDRHFDPVRVPTRITINKVYFVPIGLCPVLLACSETTLTEVWVPAS